MEYIKDIILYDEVYNIICCIFGYNTSLSIDASSSRRSIRKYITLEFVIKYVRVKNKTISEEIIIKAYNKRLKNTDLDNFIDNCFCL